MKMKMAIPSANTSTPATANSNMSVGTCILKLLAPKFSAETQGAITDTQKYADTRTTVGEDLFVCILILTQKMRRNMNSRN